MSITSSSLFFSAIIIKRFFRKLFCLSCGQANNYFAYEKNFLYQLITDDGGLVVLSK